MHTLLLVAALATQPTFEPVVIFHGLHGHTVVREELRVEGVPVHDAHRSVLKNAAGETVTRSGRAPALVADLERGVLRLDGRHAHKSTVGAGEPVWFRQGATLKAAYREW